MFKSKWAFTNTGISESKMENPTHSFRETNLVLQFIEELQIKSKTVMSWSSRKKKRVFFAPFILPKGMFFNICILSQCIVYWIHSQNIHTFTHQKTLLHTVFCLFLKSLKFFSVSLMLLWSWSNHRDNQEIFRK